jgi:protein O-mannosyl-transferase
MSTDRLITVQGFLEQFRQQHQHRQEKPFCFVLGAGASRMSKIPTGDELAMAWLKDIHRDLDFTGQPLVTWATEENLGISKFDLKQLASFYSELYEKRFHDSPESGYAYLEDVMRDKEPSYGYSVLAYLLSETQHKIVITTNFDNLVADALSIHSTVFPLVVGHDSLAHYARVELRRPLIAKVHGGLGFAPKSAPEELGCLTEGWCKALKRIFERCSPIVIGYDGNDGSLMTLLESIPEASIDNLRWCFYSPGDQHEENLKRVPQRVRNLVERQHGRLVPIPGFDEIMLLLQRHLNDVMPMPNLGERMHERAKKRHEIYAKQESELSGRVIGKAKSNLHTPASKASPSVDALLKEAIEKLAQSNEIKPWWQWENEASGAETIEEKNRIYLAALAALPQSPELWGNYSIFVNNECKDYEKAESLYKHAVEAFPNNADILGDYALFLYKRRMNVEEAAGFYKRAIDADPKHANNLCNYSALLANEKNEIDKAEQLYKLAIEADSKHVNSLGNYALFLQKKRKNMDKAEEYYRRAIETDPKHPISLVRYALFLQNERKNMDKAEELYKRAIEADPKNAVSLCSYASFLQKERKCLDKAEEFYMHAIEAFPDNADILGDYAIFIQNERKNMDKAEELYRRAIKADPKHANNLGNYAFFLQKERKSSDAAEEIYKRAIESAPKQINNLSNYSHFLHTIRKDLQKAEEFCKRAVEVDTEDANTLGNYAQLCFLNNKFNEGMKFLVQAEAQNSAKLDLQVEMLFYRLAHDQHAWPGKISEMAKLLKSGARSPGWPLEGNIAQAEIAGHPNAELLRAIAGVISCNESLEGLSKFPEWPGTNDVQGSSTPHPIGDE